MCFPHPLTERRELLPPSLLEKEQKFLAPAPFLFVRFSPKPANISLIDGDFPGSSLLSAPPPFSSWGRFAVAESSRLCPRRLIRPPDCNNLGGMCSHPASLLAVRSMGVTPLYTLLYRDLSRFITLNHLLPAMERWAAFSVIARLSDSISSKNRFTVSIATS